MHWIYKNDKKNFYIFCTQGEIYVLGDFGLKILTFQQFVREIDIKPDIPPKDKESMIIFVAKYIGILS